MSNSNTKAYKRIHDDSERRERIERRTRDRVRTVSVRRERARKYWETGRA
jgi:hypothetical protein